ncbi:MAG TPA: aminotransferase class V-fold PLP-dependent enzyme [Clostridia bacterium]|nr:aminotransferase class V-fold PLP-dependent enzyme [Clostridia bacterium]
MSRLPVTPAEFRQLAERVTDLAARELEQLNELPTFPATNGARTLEAFDGPAPAQGLGASAFDALEAVVAHSRPPSPRFYGYVLGSGEPVAALGDMLASVLNQNVTAWRSAPAAVTIERTVVRWLAEAIGCPGYTGSLTGGGSSANLMGLAMAREAKAPANDTGVQPGTFYASTEAHMSIPKAIALLGLGHKSLRLVAVDDNFRMIPEALAEAISQDVKGGYRPIAVIGSGGTVSTGSIDPLRDIGEIAHQHGAWFHVDGAYGVLAAMAAPEKFDGLDLADSLSLDAHKWLYQPVDCGCLLYRDPVAAQKAFSHSGDYARALSSDPIEGFAFFEESMELSRRFRALKIWLSLRYHGMDAFRASIARDMELARHLEDSIRAHPALEMMAPVELSAVCFRFTGGENLPLPEDELNRINAALLRRIIARGRVYISNATIDTRFVLRACIVNHRATASDVDLVISETLAAAAEVMRA